MKKVVLASNNQGKLKEFHSLFERLDIDIVPQQAFFVEEAEETGLTFVENAILKARNACKHTKLPAIADDSGLIVDALNGKPGIYSARFAGKNAPQKAHTDKLLAELEGVEKERRTARFFCALVFLRHAEDPAPIIAEATWEGTILFEPQGKEGFGYDPIFYAPEFQCSAAELTKEQKNKISHRGKALRLLIDKIKRNDVW